MERIKRDEFLTWSIGKIREDHSELVKTSLCRALSIKPRTLDQYISVLITRGLIIRLEDGSLILTSSGTEIYSSISSKIDSVILDPSINNTSRRVYLRSILDMLYTTYEIIQMVNALLVRGRENVRETMSRISSYRSDPTSEKYIHEILKFDGSGSDLDSLNDILGMSTIYNTCGEFVVEYHETDIDALILQAEILRRKNLISDAKCIYRGLLEKKFGLEANRWTICISGLIQCIVYENEIEDALKILEKIIKTTSDPVNRSFFMKLKGDIIQDIGRFDEASKIYRSSLGTFQEKEYPLIRSSILNNLGVLYMRKGEPTIAGKQWEDAYRITLKEKMTWMSAMTSINLADVYSLQGNIDKAMRLLRRSRKALEGSGDLEGISAIDFNKALVYIEIGDVDKAKRCFERSKEFPLNYKLKSEERSRVFNERLGRMKK